MEKSTDQELWPLRRGAVHPPSKEGAQRMPPSLPPSPSDRQLLHWPTPTHWCRACCQCQGSCVGRRGKQIWRDKWKTWHTANTLSRKAIASSGWEALVGSPVRRPPQDAPHEGAPNPGPGTLHQRKVVEKGSQPNKVRGSQGQGKACTLPTVKIISLKKGFPTVPLSLIPGLKILLKVRGH